MINNSFRSVMPPGCYGDDDAPGASPLHVSPATASCCTCHTSDRACASPSPATSPSPLPNKDPVNDQVQRGAPEEPALLRPHKP